MADDATTFKVKTPSKTFSGTRYGVSFDGGTGRATKEEAERLVEHFGYTCPALEGGEEADEPSIEDVKGIGPQYAKALAAADVETPAQLIEADAADLADATELDEDHIAEWQQGAQAIVAG